MQQRDSLFLDNKRKWLKDPTLFFSAENDGRDRKFIPQQGGTLTLRKKPQVLFAPFYKWLNWPGRAFILLEVEAGYRGISSATGIGWFALKASDQMMCLLEQTSPSLGVVQSIPFQVPVKVFSFFVQMGSPWCGSVPVGGIVGNDLKEVANMMSGYYIYISLCLKRPVEKLPVVDSKVVAVGNLWTSLSGERKDGL